MLRSNRILGALWYAIDYQSGKVLAYAFGARRDEVFLQLKALLKPFDITRFYTDGWGAYERHLDASKACSWQTKHTENRKQELEFSTAY